MPHMVTISPTRTYVAMCYFKAYYFRKFVLPEEYENNSAFASWYFLNILDLFSCVYECITFEDYSNFHEATPMVAQKVTS